LPSATEIIALVLDEDKKLHGGVERAKLVGSKSPVQTCWVVRTVKACSADSRQLFGRMRSHMTGGGL